MSNLREIGYSDRVFQYKSTRNLMIKMALKEEPVLDKLKTAVEKALVDLPEYAVAPVKKDGKIYYEKNDRPVAFYKYDGTERYFGTEETNYYLFYILYDESSFIVSFFHGLSDFKGMWMLLMNIIYYYAVELGMDVPDISVKPVEMDDTERYDPYRKFEDRDAVAWLPEVKGEVFRIPEEKLPDELHRQHEYDITLSVQRFIEKTHEWNTSATAALSAIISNSLAKLYNVGDQDVTLKISADMRPYFETQTRVNFSEAIVLTSGKEFRELPFGEQCSKLRADMKAQLNAAVFKKHIAAGVANSKTLCGELDKPDVGIDFPALTYVLTYPGRMDLPEEYAPLVSDFVLMGYFPVDTIRFQIKSTGDVLRIGLVQMFDTDKIINAIADYLGELGFETETEDLGRFGGDRYDASRIREIS